MHRTRLLFPTRNPLLARLLWYHCNANRSGSKWPSRDHHPVLVAIAERLDQTLDQAICHPVHGHEDGVGADVRADVHRWPPYRRGPQRGALHVTALITRGSLMSRSRDPSVSRNVPQPIILSTVHLPRKKGGSRTGTKCATLDGMTRRLSPAEIESLAALAQADHSRDAARIRGVSEQTIKNELTSAYRKLGVRSRTSAFRRLGWLTPPPRATIRTRMRRPSVVTP